MMVKFERNKHKLKEDWDRQIFNHKKQNSDCHQMLISNMSQDWKAHLGKNNEPGKTRTSANGIHSNRILGRGASGTAYHDFIEDIQVAVKMLSLSSVHGYQQFVAEVKLLIRVYHRNLTSIIGYCNEETNIGLIYEYMANGNLGEHLSGFDPASTNFPPNNNILPPQTSIEVVNQRDTDLFFMWQRYKILEHEAEEKAQALKKIRETVNHKNHIDGSVKLIGTSLFGVPKVKQ
ncbi:L-type lectin-domain containing receptor kinase IX.2-like isoform X1 [Arachis ipaensis]|uniref:L-type lectin-domain containing receptor kinase IX.2-like isoform X1 n=1 Tax=Arachis ipaensis TaxID=130454 RepID=UPI0007AEECA0|nr:L-type lectin-domain containing receptor kinase IX.2-like isoform X1 [Arachis ipaensis]XP_020966428.1 L-type lectin-domain containing receptor kinase IX.2-like isoform X1 [Arachis ipaensis]